MVCNCNWHSHFERSMKTIRLIVGFLCYLSMSPAFLAQGHGADIAVVVNPRNTVSNLTLGELRRIYGGQKGTWSNGTPIKLLVRGEGTRERNCLLGLLGLNETSYKQMWVTTIYRGEATEEPTVLPSNGMQKEALNAFPGGIALVGATDIKPGMKVLKIHGKLPGETGYPIF